MNGGSETGPTVLDTTVLSNFAHVGQVAVLEAFPRVATVPAVRDEIEAGKKTHPYLERAMATIGDGIAVLSVSDADRTLESTFQTRIDPGEAQALAVAANRRGVLVTDDGDARHLAREHEVPITGSVGVLLRATDWNLVSERTADQWLKRWIDEAGFRAPSRELQDYQ